MKIKFNFALFTALLSVTFLLSSCGDKPIDIDTAPFDKAITSFLASEHMDMKINKFKALTVEGQTANATCSMKSQTGLGPAVVWKFKFKKESDAWKVDSFQY